MFLDVRGKDMKGTMCLNYGKTILSTSERRSPSCIFLRNFLDSPKNRDSLAQAVNAQINVNSQRQAPTVLLNTIQYTPYFQQVVYRILDGHISLSTSEGHAAQPLQQGSSLPAQHHAYCCATLHTGQQLLPLLLCVCRWDMCLWPVRISGYGEFLLMHPRKPLNKYDSPFPLDMPGSCH